MKYHVHGADITEAMKQMIHFHLYSSKVDFVGASHTHLFDMVITADTCDYDIDIGKTLWFSKSRWNRLLNKYVDFERLKIFLDRSKRIVGGTGTTVGMLFKDPESQDEARVHRWGGCLQSLIFRIGSDKQPELVMNSRTCFAGYMACIDAGLVYHISKEIIDPESIKFRWNIADQQISYGRILAYIFSDKDLLKTFKKYKESDHSSPTWRNVKGVFRRNFQAYDEKYWSKGKYVFSKYGPIKRLQIRYLAVNGHKQFEKKIISFNMRDFDLKERL